MREERGSVTVFMSVMLLVMVMFFMAVIEFAKSFVGASLVLDEDMVIEASLYACYNKPIRDAYGLTVYTKSPDYLSHQATVWFNESADPLSLSPAIDKAGNMVSKTGNITVTYSYNDSLDIDSNFVDLMVGYIKERDTLCNEVTPDGISAISSNLDKANQLRERFIQDMEDAQNGIETYKDHGLTEDEDVALLAEEYAIEQVESIRNSMYLSADADRMTLDMTFQYVCYPDINPKNPGVSKIADESWSEEEVLYQSIALIDEMNSYYSNLDAVKSAVANKSEAYYVAEYATEMFSAFHYYGETSLSGNYYSSGDMVSVNPFCETEYLIFGNGDIYVDSDIAKCMIYDNLYMGHLVNLMINQPVDKRIIAYAMVLSDGDMSKVNMIVDALYSAEAAELAYQDLCEVYRFNRIPVVIGDSGTDFGEYQYYMELFCLIECCRNQSSVVAREKQVIEYNAANSCEEAREFRFATAYTDFNKEMDVNFAQ